MDIIPIFPTVVGRFTLNRELTKKEKTLVADLPKRKNNGNLTSEDSYILNLKQLKSINNFLTASMKEYFKNIYAAEEGLEIYITQSWVNFTNKGEFHHRHKHPNSIISGVFYLSAMEEFDRIIFYNENKDILRFDRTDYNAWNSQSWWLPASTNVLYIFPSHLEHSVEINNQDYTRISLSFNTFLRGNIGRRENLTEISL